MANDDRTDPTVRDNPPLSRYELLVDGSVAGFVTYEIRGDDLALVHTKLDEAYEGEGFGSVLARATLDDLRARGKRVVPVCPFIAEWIRRHPDYRELVAPAASSK